LRGEPQRQNQESSDPSIVRFHSASFLKNLSKPGAYQFSIHCKYVRAAFRHISANYPVELKSPIYAGSNPSSIAGARCQCAWSHPPARFSTGSTEIIFAGA
jgi:hypothetical protein